MRKDRFTDEALAAAKALADLKYSESEEDQLRFSEAYDFARCQRPDGSFYAIAEGKQCRKGSKAAPAQPKPRTSAAARMAAAYDKAQKSGGFAPKKKRVVDAVKAKAAGGKKLKTDFRKEVEEGAAKRKKRDAEIMAKQRRLATGKKFIMRARQGMKRLEAQYRAAAGRPGGNPERIMKAMQRLRKRAEQVGAELEKLTGTKGLGKYYVP